MMLNAPSFRASAASTHILCIPFLSLVPAGSWRVQAVPRDPDSFATRKPLPAAWAGLRDAELSEKSGIPGCIFVHAGRFIGGNATYEGALRMAVAAVEAAE